MLEEIEDPQPEDGLGPAEVRALRRVLAGLLVETGGAEKAAVKRWQKAVLEKTWDADACADELIATARPGASAEGALAERAARLQRDLLMASHLRGIKGASRRVRGATRNASAALLVQVAVFVVMAAIIAIGLVVARVGYEKSIDGIIDRVVETLGFG